MVPNAQIASQKQRAAAARDHSIGAPGACATVHERLLLTAARRTMPLSRDVPGPSRGAEGSVRLVKAYVLIVTTPEATHRVAVQVRSIRHVSEVYEVMGPYDIVAVIETESLADVPGILADQIRTLDGIQSTTSLVAFPDRADD